MTPRLLLAPALAAAAVLLPAGPALAAPSACPPSYQAVTERDLLKQLRRDGAPAEAFEGLPGVFARTDANGNGTVCQQNDSYGRAPGLPSYFSNFRDDSA